MKKSLKVKQVAKKARQQSESIQQESTPIVRTENLEQQRNVLDIVQPTSLKTVVEQWGEEFRISGDDDKQQAIDAQRKAELKESLQSMVAVFQANVNAKLTKLSDRLEQQLKPMMESITSIAVAKAVIAADIRSIDEMFNYGDTDLTTTSGREGTIDEFFAESRPQSPEFNSVENSVIEKAVEELEQDDDITH